MASRHLSEYYSFKEVSFLAVRPALESDLPLEEQIYAQMEAGHRAYFDGKYPLALQYYLAVAALFAKLVEPAFPPWITAAMAEELVGIDLTPPLVAVSAELLRRRPVLGPTATVVPPVDPPAELIDLAERAAGPIDLAQRRFALGLAAAQMGDFELAQRHLQELDPESPLVYANARAALALVALARGDHESARAELQRAAEAYSFVERPDAVAAMEHNLGVARTVAGDVEAAGRHFSVAAVGAPLAFNWSVTQTVNPGIASVSRPMGRSGLPFLLATDSANWITAPVTVATPATSCHVLIGEKTVTLDLTADAASVIIDQVLQPRTTAQSLAELDVAIVDPIGRYRAAQLSSHLAHIRGFMLPLSLGDAYRALGDYERASTYYLKARDYPYLNPTIERPVVWRKLARNYLEWGRRLYRDRDAVAAAAQFERIARLGANGIELSGPLYEGAFAAVVPETQAFLDAPEGAAGPVIDYERRLILLDAVATLTRIANGINALGFRDDVEPIHPWRYLQNVARYFANQAIQAERAYVTFKSTAEESAFTRRTLEQAVDAQEGALAVERERELLARRQRDAARRAAELATLRRQNAVAQRDDHQAVSQQLSYFDEMTAFINTAEREIHIDPDWAAALGLQVTRVREENWNLFTGSWSVEYIKASKTSDVMQLMARNRGRITRDYERRTMDRKVAELRGEEEVAQAEVVVADQMVEVARAERRLAALRVEQARDQLDFYNAREFTPELWDNLAEAQRALSRRYLDWAIGAAFLMERAFNIEEDAEVRRIRFDYERSELRGLLAADFLLADIDQFSYDRLLAADKRVPVKVSIALADHYPFAFRRFQATGRIDFHTFVEDFDRWHPGTFLRKLRRVEVAIEGLVGPRGIHGTLTHAGIAVDRDRSGHVRRLVRKPETMVLSRFDLRGDGFAFVAGEEQQLATFENAGVASGWILDFPPESNDVDYRAIANVHLVLYFDASYRDEVRDAVRAELAATAVYEHSLGIGVSFQYPDEFFRFQDTGQVSFAIGPAAVPYDQTEPILRDLYLLIETDEGTSAAGLTVRVSLAAGAVTVAQVADANGMLATGTGTAPLNAARGKALVDTWTVAIPEEGNEGAFAAGFAWEKVKNLYLFAEYDYTPRGRPAVAASFSTDPLPDFAVVVDPRATSSPQSAWSHDPVRRCVAQTAAIAGPAGAPDNGPDKPGTYLVGRSDRGWPTLGDVVVRCRVTADKPGGVGLVFRYQDVDNFCYFLMDAGLGYRRLGVKQGGVFRDLATAAVDTGAGFELARAYEVAVAAVGPAFVACLDGELILSGRDEAVTSAGRVGFYTWGDVDACFSALSARSV